MNSKRIAIIGSSITFGIFVILGVGGFLGYKKAVANLKEIDSRLLKILKENNSLNVANEIFKTFDHYAYSLAPIYERMHQKLFFFKLVEEKVQFNDEKSAEYNIEVFNEFLRSKNYTLFIRDRFTYYCLSKQPEELNKPGVSFLIKFFYFFGCFKKSVFHFDQRIYKMLKSSWDDNAKARFVFGIQGEKVIFGIFNLKAKKIIDHEIFEPISISETDEKRDNKNKTNPSIAILLSHLERTIV